VLETLVFTYTGVGLGSGAARFEVTSPADVTSRPVTVHYLCP